MAAVLAPKLRSSNTTPSGFVGTTFEVAVDTFTQLRGSLGHEWDLLMLSLGSAILYKATKALQLRAERALFVQILVGGPTAADEEIMGADQQLEALHQGLDPYEIDGATTRASHYVMRRREEAQRLVDDVRAYAARRALESANPLRWCFPLPTLRVKSAIDAATLCDDDAEVRVRVRVRTLT
jgi:hypothetical protein